MLQERWARLAACHQPTVDDFSEEEVGELLQQDEVLEQLLVGDVAAAVAEGCEEAAVVNVSEEREAQPYSCPT